MPDLATEIRRRLPPNIGLGIGDPLRGLWPGEVLPDAVPARLREFKAGRSAARAAMVEMGQPEAAIPIGQDRAPIWPENVIGSISHCAGACVAIAASTVNFQGLGLDIEPKEPLSEDLWEIVLRPNELELLLQIPATVRGISALRTFVAKEAVYKAQYAKSRQLFDFQTLSVAHIGELFTARFERNIAGFPAASAIVGRFVEPQNFQAAIAWVPQ